MNIEELQTVNSSLDKFLFPGILPKLCQIDEKSGDISEKILIQNRQTCYLFYLTENPEHVCRVVNQDKLYHSASLLPIDALRVFEPLEVQSITLLLKVLLSDPPRFVDSVIKCSKCTGFRSLILLSIPSVFAFFSSKEAISFSYNFYADLYPKVSFEDYCKIVFPFFNSSCISRFSELVFNKLFWSNFSPKSEICQFCQCLIDVSSKHIGYLPEPHLVLLRILSLQWNIVKLWQLLIRVLLFPQLRIYSQTSPFIYNPLATFDIKGIGSFLFDIGVKKTQNIVLPNLSFNNSYYEIPDTFVPYDHTFALDLVLTLADIDSLMMMQVDVPHHTKRLQDLCIQSKVDPFLPFKIHFYPRMLKPPTFSFRPLFSFSQKFQSSESPSILAQLWSTFESAAELLRKRPLELLMEDPIKTYDQLLNIKINKQSNKDFLKKYGLEKSVAELTSNANFLEQLLLHAMFQDGLVKWNETCSFHNLQTSFFVAQSNYFSSKMTKPDHIYMNFWDSILSFPELNNIRYWSALICLDNIENIIVKKYQKELTHLENLYKKYLRRKKSMMEIAPAFKSKVLMQHMWETNGILQFASNSTPLLTRYIILSTFLEEVERMSIASGYGDNPEKISEIIKFSFVEGSYVWILRTVALLDGVLFSDDRFEGTRQPILFDRWKRFTAVFIQFMGDDVSLVSSYGKLVSSGNLKFD